MSDHDDQNATDAPNPTIPFRRNAWKRGFEIGTVRDEVDRKEWIKPRPAAPTITMPTLSNHGITDETLGMPRSDAAQLRAEGFLEVVANQRIYEGNEQRHARRLGITVAELLALRRNGRRAAC